MVLVQQQTRFSAGRTLLILIQAIFTVLVSPVVVVVVAVAVLVLAGPGGETACG